MDWATTRKLQYFGIIVAVITIFIVIPFYIFIYRAPTCFDGFKNGEEVGVDCGGSCRLLCSAEISQPISRWDPRFFEVSEGVYSVLAYLENPNIVAEVLNAPYIFRLYDKENILIAERKGKTFIPKGENFAIFEGNINTGERVPYRASFDFEGDLIWVRNTNSSPEISVSNETLSRQDLAPRLDAKVKNNSLVRVSDIELVAIVFDGAGNAIGSSRTFIESLEDGEEKSVVFTWPRPFETKAEVCTQPVDVALVIDRSGSMDDLSLDPPQPLTSVKEAAIFFVNQLNENDQGSLVTFATNVSEPIDSQLTSDFESLKKAIQDIFILSDGIQNTNIGDGLAKAREELNSQRHKSDSDKVMVVLTDGIATHPVKLGDEKYPETYALSIANQSKIDKISIFTIGLGKDLNTEFLKAVASSSDEFYLAPTGKDLTSVYNKIATSICKLKPAVIQIIPRVYPRGFIK